MSGITNLPAKKKRAKGKAGLAKETLSTKSPFVRQKSNQLDMVGVKMKDFTEMKRALNKMIIKSVPRLCKLCCLALSK